MRCSNQLANTQGYLNPSVSMEFKPVRSGCRADVCQTARGAILIFLLLQLTHNNPLSELGSVGVSNPFTQYVQFLPPKIPLPTFWNAAERALTAGTSLEAALVAKHKSLDREFTVLREATASTGWCRDHWWSTETGRLSLKDWKHVDALYRSRALDLPGTGHAMVPCIDMANHASGDHTSALYDTDSNGNATLVLLEGKSIPAGEEVTITYGDEKGACEMLFSYGFIEDNMDSAREVFLDLKIPDDDPLKLAKNAISNSPPGFRLFTQGLSTVWEGPYIWLLCINEEDGLEFRTLQTNDGERELKVFWNDTEITDASTIGLLLKQHPLWDVFRLRVVTILQERVESQLMSLERSKTRLESNEHSYSSESISLSIRRYVLRLRDLEESLLLQAYQEFENQVPTIPALSKFSTDCLRVFANKNGQKTELLESRTVMEYLGSVQIVEDTAAVERDITTPL